MVRSTPLVTVIMSVYNGAAYLCEALDSIRQQTLQSLEFIVVDDGSRDRSWEMLQAAAAADARLVLLRNEINSGFAVSQNRAIARSRGPVIALQDQDDVSQPTRLERQLDYLRSNPEVGLVGVWPQFVDESGSPMENPTFHLVEGNDELQVRLLREACLCGPSVMVRRPWLEAAGPYDPSLRAAEDFDFLLRVAEVTRLANVPERLYLYRQHADSVSAQERFLQRRSTAMALERALSRRYGLDRPAPMLEIVTHHYLRAAFFALVEGKPAEAHRCVDRATDLAPWITQRGDLIEETVGKYCLQQKFTDPLALVDQMFQDLPCSRHLQRVRARLISRIHMRVVFEAADPAPHPAGERSLARSAIPHLWAGVQSDPRWLLNRGVWSIALHHLAGRPLRVRT